MTVEPRCWGGGGGGGGGTVSHPLQLTTGLVINSSVTTSPTLAGEHMLLIPKVSILSEQTNLYLPLVSVCVATFAGLLSIMAGIDKQITATDTGVEKTLGLSVVSAVYLLV